MKPPCGVLPLKVSDVLKPLIGIVSDPLFVVDARSLRLLQVNEPAAALFQLSERELLDSSLDRILDQRSIKALLQVPSQRTSPTRERVRFLGNRGGNGCVDMAALAFDTEGQTVLLLT